MYVCVCMYVCRVMAADTSKVRAMGVLGRSSGHCMCLCVCVCSLCLFLSVVQAVTVGSQAVWKTTANVMRWLLVGVGVTFCNFNCVYSCSSVPAYDMIRGVSQFFDLCILFLLRPRFPARLFVAVWAVRTSRTDPRGKASCSWLMLLVIEKDWSGVSEWERERERVGKWKGRRALGTSVM